MTESSVYEVFKVRDVAVQDELFTEIAIPESLKEIIKRLPMNEEFAHIITCEEGERLISQLTQGRLGSKNREKWLRFEKEVTAVGINVETLAERIVKDSAFMEMKRDNARPFMPVLKAFDKALTRQLHDLVPKQAPVIFGQQSRQLVMDDVAVDRLLKGKSSAARKFARRRLKLLFDRCSKDVREERISVETVNRLSTFCLEIIPLIESERIVMPTADELSILFNWYLEWQTRPQQEPPVVLTTVCPDYPYEWMGTKAVFTSGMVGNDLGLIGESIMNHGPDLLQILSKSLNMSFNWIVGYAGFEAKPENLESMNISAEEFRDRLESSARKLQRKLGVPVGILPDAVDLTLEQFNEIRQGFMKKDFNIRRKGMDALSDAVDARDWASIFCIANRLNAIIIDGASVYMGRKAYKKAGQILHSTNHTPRFFCMCNYMGFAE